MYPQVKEGDRVKFRLDTPMNEVPAIVTKVYVDPIPDSLVPPKVDLVAFTALSDPYPAALKATAVFSESPFAGTWKF